MPSLKSILKPLQTIPIEFDGPDGVETVMVTYRPQYMTPEFEDELRGLSEEDKSGKVFLQLFCKVVKSWDLKMEETDEEPIPVTVSALRPIAYEILSAIMEKVQGAVVPNQPKGPTSEGSLQPAAGSDRSLNGTD